MPRIHRVFASANQELDKLLLHEGEYQRALASNRAALVLCEEYVFLSGYKIWENFLESMFISQARYNDPVSGKRTFPFLAPKTERHALELIKLEKDYTDWTSPDNVVKRAEILFRNHKIISDPIKASMNDLRDMKKIRNYIAHGSHESERNFERIARQRTGRAHKCAGDFLLDTPIGSSDYYLIYYLKLIKKLTSLISG